MAIYQLNTIAWLEWTIKTHKEDHYPVRPIIAAINPIGKNLEPYIHKLLKLFITPINTHTNTSLQPKNHPNSSETKQFLESKSHITQTFNAVLNHVQGKTFPLNLIPSTMSTCIPMSIFNKQLTLFALSLTTQLALGHICH